MKTLAVQTVFYHQTEEEIRKLRQCVSALEVPEGWTIDFRTGNCGDTPLSFSTDSHHFEFGENLGFGKGQNRLFSSAPSDRVWLLNPDTVFDRDTLLRLFEFADARPGWGIIEPRLLPTEHPKWVDFESFETGWCSGCAPLIESPLFEQVGGFDESFFLYGEDVDLSWRIKAAGGKLYCCPGASVYHSRTGPASAAEAHWSAVSELQLLRKYGRKAHYLARLGDHAASGDLERLKADLKETLRATPAERAAASWSGRLNTPLRWRPNPMESRDPVAGSFHAGSVEAAICALAAGAAVTVSSQEIADRLPFEAEIAAGEGLEDLLTPRGLPIAEVGKLHVVSRDRGYLTAQVHSGSHVDAYHREETESIPEPISDPEGWKVWARAIRGWLRLRGKL